MYYDGISYFEPREGKGGGGGVLGLIFAGYMCRWPLRACTPLQSFLWPIIDPDLVTFGHICNFRDPNVVKSLSILMN